jgi:uncharacterized membrane protein
MSDQRDEQLFALEHQVALLTKRVYQLELAQQGKPAEAPPLPIHLQPLPPPAPEKEPDGEIPEQPEPAPPPPPPEDSADWEGRFGTNWLNRAGVLLIVIGIVLFLGYAMNDMGPPGRVAIASLTGAAMLAVGYWFEAKGGWRPWSLVMLAGGFAVLYTTAYAAHAVRAAQVISNTNVGVALQTAIAVAAIWQAIRFSSERATMVAFLAAFLGVLSSEGDALRFAGSLPLTLGGLWLGVRGNWETLPWSIWFYSWSIGLATGAKLGESAAYGQPVAWFYLAIFAAYEIWSRTRAERAWHPLFQLLNIGAFFLCSTQATTLDTEEHLFRIIGLLAITGLASSVLRYGLQVRREALSEGLTLAASALAIGKFLGERDPLLACLVILGCALAALAWNRRQPTFVLTIAAELTLAVIAVALMFIFPDSRALTASPLIIRQALPHILILMGALFAAGRLFTETPWPSWLGLVVLAEATLWTVPKTVGTILLALEAIMAVAIGLRLNRRPIRLGGLALFAFSILKVFLYDLSELSTLPRILSFLVLGALLLGASWAYTRYRRELQKYL